MTKKIIRLTESDLHRIVKESVNRILKENIRYRKNLREAKTHLGYWERNKHWNQDPLFEQMKAKVEKNLRRAGLTLPFAVRNYADWNIAVDIPVSAIKTYSDELVDMYNNDITKANEKPIIGGRRLGNYDLWFKGLSRIYDGDDYVNGGFNDEYVRTDSDFYNKLKNDPNTRWSNRAPMNGIARYYTRHMPDRRKEYDDLREEVLSIKSIIESAGYKVRISNEEFFDKWDDENDDYSHQKFIRFVLSSDELSKYRDDQYNTPEHMEAAEREHEAERRSEQAFEDWWIRNNG